MQLEENLNIMTSPRNYEQGITRVHLGCGRKILPEYINIDRIDKAEIVADLTKGIPLDDNSVDYIFSEDFLEHMPQDKAVFIINEIYRVLKPGGIMEHYIPNAGSRNDFASPTHLSHWNITTFEFFETGNHHFEIDRLFDGFKGEGFKFLLKEESNIQENVAQTIHVAMEKI